MTEEGGGGEEEIKSFTTLCSPPSPAVNLTNFVILSSFLSLACEFSLAF